MDFNGKRVAIAGMGVSGLSVGKAVESLGGVPTVFDQKPNDNPTVMAAVDALDAAGVDAVTGWHGRLDPAEFDLLVVSPGFPRNHPAIRDMQTGGHEVWSEIEFAYRIAKAPIIAITGTNGKSTTTVLTWQLVNAGGKRAWLCGNIAGSGYPEMTLTDAAMLAEPDDVLVAEVSSYHLEWVHQFRPRSAAVTNVTPDHMDRYADFEDYYRTKMRLFGNMRQGDTVVVNTDGSSPTPASVKEVVDPTARIVGFSPSGSQSLPSDSVTRSGERLALGPYNVLLTDLPVYGEHNVANLMMAWCLATAIVDPSEGMVKALKEFRGLANRMEFLGKRGGVSVVNNSMCTNPAAVIASSQSVSGRQHLLMGGVTKKLDFTPVGDYLKGSSHTAYVYGPEPDRFVSMLGGGWAVYSSLEEAFGAAVAAARDGDTILLAPGCASAEPYANFKERGDAFKIMAKDWLEN